MEASVAPAPSSTDRVDTTLSLARNPATSAVTTLQSAKPRGLKMGATHPAMTERMLLAESVATFRRKSNLVRAQITMVAMKITVKARYRKSLDLSHSSRRTFFAPGMR